MNLTEKELSVLSELLTIEENIWKKYQMYNEQNPSCNIINQGILLHKQNIEKLYNYVC